MTAGIHNKKHRKKFSTAENIAPPHNKTATGGKNSARSLIKYTFYKFFRVIIISNTNIWIT
jgi:hypothetical protein